MKKVLKILSKSTFIILFIILLLVIQARCDLAIPDYTAKIVNVGIQQNGIENSVPEAIRKTELDKISLLIIKEDYNYILSSYNLLDKDIINSNDYETYVERYPILEKEPIYVLKEDLSSDTIEQLNTKFSVPILVLDIIESEDEEVLNQFSQAGLQMGISIENSDDIFEFLSMLNEEQRNEIISKFTEKFSGLEQSMLTQMAVASIKNEYQQIGIDTNSMQMQYILDTGVIMLGITLILVLAIILKVFLSSRVAASFARDLRKEVVNKVMSFSNKEFEDFSTASLITRSTNDIQQIQMLIVMLLRVVLFAPIIGIGAFVKVSQNEMSWVIGLVVLVISVVVIVLFSIALPKFKILQKIIDKLNLVSREILTGLQVIRAFSTEKHEEERFDKANTDLTKVQLFVNRIMSIMMPTMMFIMNAASILIIWAGASKIEAGTLQVGTLMAFITYTMHIIISFLMISMMSIMLPRAWVSIKRIAEILNKEVSIKQKEDTVEFDESKKGIVEFKDVYFRYPDAEEDVLQNISFVSKPGTVTAFIGSTGSGKSTLINLIPRFFDVTGGKILIDGVNIKDADIHKLRDKIGYIPQKGLLFSGTIKSNIAFGNDNLTEAELKNAARIAQATDFIEEKEEKYDTPISQGGTNVSGGQRQRLAIARAIATNPEIYIFDDSFSALDYKTDAKLRKVISEEIRDATIFIVAQRISTIMNADQIIVLDNGKVVGIGTHKELLENCEIYKEIASSQFSKGEI